MEYFGRAQSAVEKNKYAEAEEKVNLAVLGSYGADGEIDNKLLKENINNIDGIYEPIEDDVASSELFEIIVDGYAFTIQKNGKVEGNEELATPEDLPENTEGIEAGARVQLEESWKGATQAKTTVYAVSDGKKHTIPIPKGFYYVGGTEETGVVISDSLADKDKGKGQTNVTKDLEGNQFVWIPCEEKDYQEYDWGDEYKNGNDWDSETPEEEKKQIKKYGGFYIGRYEAGTSEVTLKNGEKIEEKQINVQDTKDNIYGIDKVTISSKPTSKANEIPYIFSDYNTEIEMSERMYSNSNYVSSELITKTQWDVMLNYISGETDKSVDNAKDENKYTDLKTECNWGNYSWKELNNCTGRYCIMDKQTITMKTLWLENKSKTNKLHTDDELTVLTTASTEEVKKKNIYDVAGNVWERCQESATYGEKEGHLMLGGASYPYDYNCNACIVGFCSDNSVSAVCGFRTALNMN